MDTVARLGGDEFVVMINKLETNQALSIAAATAVAEKICESLSRPYLFLIKIPKVNILK